MTSTVRVALIGAGPAGQAHAFGYRNATMADDLRDVTVQPVVVVDPNLDLARTVAARYGFERAEADLDGLLADPSVDAVSVAVPNHLSASTVLRLLKAGKHVLCEKPLGKSAAEAAMLASAARDCGLVTAVGFSYRRIPAMAAIRRLIAAGRIGTPYFARVHFFSDYALDPRTPLSWRFARETSGGGAIVDMGTHAIDASEYLLGPVVEVTSAELGTVIAERPLPSAAGEQGELGAVTTDDTVVTALRHGSGATSSLVVSRVAAGMPCELGVEVFGSAGRVSFEFSHLNEFSLYERDSGAHGLDGPRRVIAGPDSPYFADVMPMSARGNPTGYGEAFIAQIQTFVRCVLAGTPMDTDFAAAARTMHVAQAVMDADATGRAVRVQE